MFQELSVKAYANFLYGKNKVKDAIEDFKNNEMGLSGIVVAVLLILVAVIVIITFRTQLSKFIEQMWQKITTKSDKI